MQDVSQQVSDNWNKLETVVEARVTEVLGDIGIPSADDIGKLSNQLQKLSSQVADLEKQMKANTKATPRKPAAKKKVAAKTATTT